MQAVGLTAIVAEKLAAKGIGANVVAAYYHDHVFVPSEQAVEALAVLQALHRRLRFRSAKEKYSNKE